MLALSNGSVGDARLTLDSHIGVRTRIQQRIDALEQRQEEEGAESLLKVMMADDCQNLSLNEEELKGFWLLYWLNALLAQRQEDEDEMNRSNEAFISFHPTKSCYSLFNIYDIDLQNHFCIHLQIHP